MNYTKGEWKAYESPFAPAVVIEQGRNQRQIIATCRLEQGSEDMGKALANANLIAAAPDMYGALSAIIRGIERDCDETRPQFTFHKDSPLADTLRKALAKAEGSEQ